MSFKSITIYCTGCVVILNVLNFVMADESCVDKVACELYAPDICTDNQYYQWMSTNCPKHCGLCVAPTENHIGVGKIMDNSNVGTTCYDANANCANYGTALCDDVKFFSWVNENCRKHCNRCDTSCHDNIDNCVDYGADVCKELHYYNWVEMNCRRFCARCT